MKRPHRRHFLQLAAGAAALPAVSPVASAQAYPTRPITMVVPYPAGGQADAIPRIMAEHLRASLGQPIVIENIGGAGGTLGIARVVRAQPNGYTLSFGASQTHVLSGAVYPIQFDLVNDLEPIALLVSSPLLIVSKNATPATDLKGLLAHLRANASRISQGHNGAGGGQHLCGIELQNKLGVRWLFVPYRGAAFMMTDLLAGQIDLACVTLGSSISMLRSAQVRAYAVTADTRLAAASEIPTVDEAGLGGFHQSAWYGLWAPKGTPKDVIATLNAAVVEALADPGVRRRFADLGLELPPREQQTPEALGALHKAEIAKWWPIIKAANIQTE